MTKIKILTYTVIALVILNLSMIAFLAAMGTNLFGTEHKKARKIIIEKLQLDTLQQKVFIAMVEVQIKRVKKNEKEIIATKENLYRLLTQPEIDLNAKDSLIEVLGNLQKDIESARFNHFKEVKKICKTPEQQQNFKELTLELAKMFSHKNNSPKKENK